MYGTGTYRTNLTKKVRNSNTGTTGCGQLKNDQKSIILSLQGPSSSAYVTYYKSEDALRAIQAVNNIFIDGRTLKASLGTTKYCSHFMKNQPCPKNDCMYLHELGEFPPLVFFGGDEGILHTVILKFCDSCTIVFQVGAGISLPNDSVLFSFRVSMDAISYSEIQIEFEFFVWPKTCL